MVEKHRGGIELTDWDVFFKNNDSDLYLLTDSISSYLIFCTDSFSLSKQVRLYRNNRPWVTKDLKMYLNKKIRVFLIGDKQKLNELGKQLAKIH